MSHQRSRMEYQGDGPDFVGLRHTPTPDGGMIIEIGKDPAGEGPVNVIPMFMRRPAGTNFAQAIELTDMGEFGKPKVKTEGYQDVLECKSMLTRAFETLRKINRNWWLMVVIRQLEAMAQATSDELPHDEGAMAALQEASQAVLDHMWALECQDRG